MIRGGNTLRTWFTIVRGTSVALVAALAIARPSAADSVDFNAEVLPILTAHCTSCHGGVKQAGGLSFVYPESIEEVVAPGDADRSLLLARVTESDDDYRMPPPDHGPRLADDEVAVLQRWIAQGAKWEDHWAYQPPRRWPSQKVADSDWERQPLDAFVLASLEQRGVRPAEDESAERWLRRTTLDLIGLPPTPEERAAFLAATKKRGDAAYEAVVDRLLASPRFGERWASVWFDQIRYADSRGQGEDSPREIWKYRDWVIDALNRDLPYDEFTIKQIAGDLLPERSIEDHLATAVHRLTHTNEEGGTDDEEFRIAAVLDRVQTTWQAWQATTIGCVQCHDHPYDPIKHEEFYRSVAFFNNTADCDLSDDWPTIDVPIEPSQYGVASELDRQIRELRLSLWRRKHRATHVEPHWLPSRIDSAKSSNATEVVVDRGADFDEYRVVGTIASRPEIAVELPVEAADGPITGVSVMVSPLWPEVALADAEVGFVMSRVRVAIIEPGSNKPRDIRIVEVIGDEPEPYDDPNSSLSDGRNGFGAYTRVHHQRRVVLVPESPVKAPPGSTLVVKIKYGVFDLAAFSLVGKRASFQVSTDAALTEYAQSEAIARDEQQLVDLEKARSEINCVTAPVLVERPDHLRRPSHVFVRGLFLTKDKEVFPGVPESLPERDAGLAEPAWRSPSGS